MSKRNNRERKPQASREGSFAVGEAGGKQAKAASLKGGKGVSSASKAKNVKKKGPSLLGRLMAFLLSHPWMTMLVALWAFLFFFYGDMLRVAQQRSFFVFDSLAMDYWLCQSLGWLYVTGRFLLLSCVWPLCGTLLIAGMLTLAARLLDYALGLRGWGRAVAFVAPFAYMGFLFYKGLNLFYLREPSWITNWPLLALALCAVLAAVRWAMKRAQGRKVESTEVAAEPSRPLAKGVLAVFAALWVACAAMAMTYAQNDRLTCAMECKMMEQDWDGMVQLAMTSAHPTRTVAAYHALALNQNGQLATELFNLPYQYPNAHLSRKSGSFDGGLDYIVIDCNFYAGLTRSAYHEAMEQNVLEGPTIHRIKRMTQCALLDGENALAEKYLAILKKAPFEGDFVEKYSAMLKDPGLITQDQELVGVMELQPVNDNFEQIYREPMFLGYNLALTEAKTMRGLHNSLYACLYTKDMNAFGSRIRTMLEQGVPLPKIYEEAIVVLNIKNLAVLKQIKLSPYVLQEMKDFMGECFAKGEKGEKKDLKKKAKKFEKYRGTYEYYYYFQNIPDENYVVPDEGEKGGVN